MRRQESYALSNNAATLSKVLRQAYQEGGTIGVLQHQQQQSNEEEKASGDARRLLVC